MFVTWKQDNNIFLYFSYDFLTIYDGDSFFALELIELSGDSTQDVVSSGRDIFIQFISDESEVRYGFRIQYEAGKTLCCIY